MGLYTEPSNKMEFGKIVPKQSGQLNLFYALECLANSQWSESHISATTNLYKYITIYIYIID